MRDDDPRHGTEAGHEQHQRDDETACEPCKDAKLRAARRRTKRKTMGHIYTLPLGDAYDVVTAWRAAGASLDDVGDHIGLHQSQVLRIAEGTRETVVYARTYQKIMAAAGTCPVTSAGVTRRIQGLTWLGYSVRAIAEAAGVDHDSVLDARDQPRAFQSRKVRARIVAAYDRLSMTLPAGETKQHRAGITRARNLANRNSWNPPLAWANIDAGTLATKGRTKGRPADLDPVVVDRLMDGDMSVASGATRAEREAFLARWLADGRTIYAFEHLTGWDSRRYLKRDVA